MKLLRNRRNRQNLEKNEGVTHNKERKKKNKPTVIYGTMQVIAAQKGEVNKEIENQTQTN